MTHTTNHPTRRRIFGRAGLAVGLAAALVFGTAVGDGEAVAASHSVSAARADLQPLARSTANPALEVGAIRVPGNAVPNFPNKRATVEWANQWAAYGEQEIANGLVAAGIRDKATRQAVTTAVGAAIGGSTAACTGRSFPVRRRR